MRPAWAIALLVAARASDAGGQAAGGCAPPPVWSAPDVKPGHPNEALSACLRSEAYKARNLQIPIASIANGIAASCEVEVEHIEHAFVFDNAFAPEQQRQALEQEVMRQATADATRYRACAAR